MIGPTYLPTRGRGWSDGAKVLGTLSVPGRLTNLDNSRARTYFACSRCGIFILFYLFFYIFSLVYHFYFLFPSHWETARYRLLYCLKRPLNPNQPTYLPRKKVIACHFIFRSVDYGLRRNIKRHKRTHPRRFTPN